MADLCLCRCVQALPEAIDGHVSPETAEMPLAEAVLKATGGEGAAEHLAGLRQTPGRRLLASQVAPFGCGLSTQGGEDARTF